MTSAAERKIIYLVDGSSYIFRAFHALPPMTRPDGTPVNAVYGFTNMLTKLAEDTGAEYMAVLFDSARKTFRNEVYAEYKAHRPPPPEDLVPQFALIREATDACNLPSLEMPGFEADDLIATLARMAIEREYDVTIVSSDKDLMQLVGAGSPHAGPDEKSRRRTAGGLRKVRSGTRQGGRRAGAGGRFHGQRAWRAGESASRQRRSSSGSTATLTRCSLGRRR